jgi:phospholipase/carboxylesterase
MMSLGLLQDAPEHLAGVIALSGRDPAALFEARAERPAVARVPLFVAHGTQDELLPVANGRAIRARFENISQDFEYREFPIGHGVSEVEIREIGQWLGRHLDG